VGIVGDRPESGVRIDLARPVEGGPPWRYEGEATTERERFPLTAVVSADGNVVVDVSPGSPVGLADKVRLLARSAWRHAREDDLPPPRRIVRWRANG